MLCTKPFECLNVFKGYQWIKLQLTAAPLKHKCTIHQRLEVAIESPLYILPLIFVTVLYFVLWSVFTVLVFSVCAWFTKSTWVTVDQLSISSWLKPCSFSKVWICKCNRCNNIIIIYQAITGHTTHSNDIILYSLLIIIIVKSSGPFSSFFLFFCH